MFTEPATSLGRPESGGGAFVTAGRSAATAEALAATVTRTMIAIFNVMPANGRNEVKRMPAPTREQPGRSVNGSRSKSN